MNRHRILLEVRDRFRVVRVHSARDLPASKVLANSLGSNNVEVALETFSRNSRRCSEAMENSKEVSRYRLKVKTSF